MKLSDKKFYVLFERLIEKSQVYKTFDELKYFAKGFI